MKALVNSIALAFFSSLQGTLVAQVEFHTTGWIGSDRFVIGQAVNDDGEFVTGEAYDSGFTAQLGFGWSATSGIFDLGSFTSSRHTTVNGCAPKGTACVFGKSYDSHIRADVAFVWTGASGMVALSETLSDVLGISKDGGRVVGWSRLPNSTTNDAFLWSFTDGLRSLGGIPQNNIFPTSVNQDGSLITGWGGGRAGRIVFRWTAESGFAILGTAGGPEEVMVVSDVCLSGKAVGRVEAPGPNRGGFVWTPEGGRTFLRVFESETSTAQMISDDGQFVFGQYYQAGTGQRRAYRWSDTGKTIDIHSVVERYHFNTDGWRVTNVIAMSDNGRSFAGQYSKPNVGSQGFVLHFSCNSDVNIDGIVDHEDLELFIHEFEHEPSASDYNHDGFVDFFDFLDFMTNYEAGC